MGYYNLFSSTGSILNGKNYLAFNYVVLESLYLCQKSKWPGVIFWAFTYDGCLWVKLKLKQNNFIIIWTTKLCYAWYEHMCLCWHKCVLPLPPCDSMITQSKDCAVNLVEKFFTVGEHARVVCKMNVGHVGIWWVALFILLSLLIVNVGWVSTLRMLSSSNSPSSK